MARSGAANERRHGQVPAWCRPDRARHGAAAGNTPLSTQARARVPAACGASRRGARRCRPREAKGSSRLRALRVIFCFCRRSAERAAATCACMAVDIACAGRDSDRRRGQATRTGDSDRRLGMTRTRDEEGAVGRAQARRGSQEAARGDWLPPLIASCPCPLANDFVAVNGLQYQLLSSNFWA